MTNKKKKIILLIILIAIIVSLFVKYFVPICYKERNIDLKMVESLTLLQQANRMELIDCAKYCYYYPNEFEESETTWLKRINVTIKMIEPDYAKIKIYDPQCDDDSVMSMIDIFYFKHEDNLWIPVKHEWIHRGRGRFGWTTKPTI